MESRGQAPQLKKLLATCEDLQQIRGKLADPELGRESRTRLRRQSKRKAQRLTRDLKNFCFRGVLGTFTDSQQFSQKQFEILAFLLQRQMHAEESAVEGRLILGSIFETSFDALAGLDLLQEGGTLRTSGLVETQDPSDEDEGEGNGPHDPLQIRFQISEEALHAFRRELIVGAGGGGETGETGEAEGRVAPEGPQAPPYAHNHELLTDLRILHNLHKLRAEKAFRTDHWERLHRAAATPGGELSRRIEEYSKNIACRIRSSTQAHTFPGLRFMREYGLSEGEMIVVVHLLFKELYEGDAYADVAELLKLVSANERELLRQCRLLAEDSALIKHEILSVEPMLEGRMLTGEAHLNDWVVNYLIGAPATDENIHPDERLDWHFYLNKMDNTQDFYRDLEAN